MRKILITDDDGIEAGGIIRLAREALRFGEVWVVAPDGQRSAASHSITLHSHIDLQPHTFPVEGVHAIACSGTPGDCIRLGCLYVMDQKPDLVLTGINYGYNAATDIQYSATVGAALEANFQGIAAIAFSEGACDCHEVTDAYLHPLLTELAEQPFVPGQVINVNFPGCPLSGFKGILRDRAASKGTFYRDRYEVKENLPGGGVRLMVHGVYNEDAEPDTDFRAIVDGYISIGMVRNVG